MHPALIKALAAEHIQDMQAEAAMRRRMRRSRRRYGQPGTRRQAPPPQPGCAQAPRLRSA